MFRQRFTQMFIVLGIVAAGGATEARAQGQGYGQQELSRIQNQSTGTGHSVESLNQIALRNAQARVPNVGQSSYRSSPSSFGLNSALASKPFSSYSPAPTTSPYLNLFREDLSGNDDLNYQTLVRPMLQQQRFNDQMQRQSMEVAQRLQSIAAQPDFNPQGSQSQYPTGHQTVFNYLGHYYPSASRRRR